MEIVKFDAHVREVKVKEKVIKHPETRESPAFLETLRIGRIVLEYDADSVGSQALIDYIRDVPTQVRIGDSLGA